MRQQSILRWQVPRLEVPADFSQAISTHAMGSNGPTALSPPYFPEDDLYGFPSTADTWPQPTPGAFTWPEESQHFEYDDVDLSHYMIEPDAVASPHAVGALSGNFRGSTYSEGSVGGGAASGSR